MEKIWPMFGLLLIRALPEFLGIGFTMFSPGYIKTWLAPKTHKYLKKQAGIDAVAETSRITDVIFLIFAALMLNLTFMTFFLLDLNISEIIPKGEYVIFAAVFVGFIIILIWGIPYNKRGNIQDYIEEIKEDLDNDNITKKRRWMPGIRSAKKLRGIRLGCASFTLLLKISGLVLSIWSIKVI